MSKLLGLFVIFITSTNYCLAQSTNCGLSELDSRMARIIGQFGLKEIKFPENEQEMDSWCRSFPKSVNSAKDYAKKCLKGLSKTIISVTIFSTEKVNIKSSNSICGNKAERNNYIARGRCGNRGKRNTSKCWNNLINNMSNVKNVTDDKLRIPLFCCQFYAWRECTVDTFKSLGPKVCSESAIEGFDTQIARGSLDPLNIFCSDYDESDKCDKLTELLPKVRSNRSRNKTPFPAVFEVFDSL